MILMTPHLLRGKAPSGSGLVAPNYCFNRDVASAAIYESVSGTNTGISWGTAGGAAAETVFGITGWRVPYATQRAFNLSLGATRNLYAFGLDILAILSGLSTTTVVSSVVEFNSGPKLTLGPTLGNVTNDVVTLNSVGATQVACYTNASGISLASRKLDIFFAWNGSTYDMYVNGEKITVETGTYSPWSSILTASSFTYGQNSTLDCTMGAIAFWTDSQLTSDEAAAIAADFRGAIA